MMKELIAFYVGLPILLKLVVCVVLLIVAVGIAYLCTYVISKHMIRKRKQLEAAKKNGNIRR